MSAGRWHASSECGGFTLLEMLMALALGALVISLAVPRSVALYDNARYRDAVRSLGGAAASARYRAVTSGSAVDLVVEPVLHRYAIVPALGDIDDGNVKYLSPTFQIAVTAAGQLGRTPSAGTIRFYPDGSASGGSITLSRPGGDGVRLRVDWLLGAVTRESPQ